MPYPLVRLITWEVVIMVLRIYIIFLASFLFHTMAFGQGGKAMALVVSSPAFESNRSIPVRYTCEGEDISPPLHFFGAPENTKSLVLIVDDPDAPDPAAPKMTWVHWLLYNMPRDTAGLAEGEPNLPPGTRQGTNDFGRTRYGGPCPPIGEHRYMFKLYALNTMLPDLGRPNKETLLQAMDGHILEQARLIGLYQKQR